MSPTTLRDFLPLVILVDFALCSLNSNPEWSAPTEIEEVVPIITSINGCSSRHQLSVMSNLLPCTPRPSVIKIPPPSNEISGMDDLSRSIVRQMPSHVTVDRCSGSCMFSPVPGAHTCQASRKENVTVQIMSIQTTFSAGIWNTVCSTAIVENHLECQCSCRQKEEHCNPSLHTYDRLSCSCQCKNDRRERANCAAGNTGKKWDPRTCTCTCPRNSLRQCSTGFTFDFVDSCACIRIPSRVASGGLTFIVVFVLAFGLIAFLVVSYLKKHRTNHRRIQSDSNLERLLREAFIDDTSSPIVQLHTDAESQR